MDSVFASEFRGPSWDAWRAILGAMFGLKLTAAERKVVEECTGRTDLPAKAFNETWVAVGRRGGKSKIVALIGVYLACFRDWTQYLSLGERGKVLVIACDRTQAGVIFGYCDGMISSIPELAALVTRRTENALELSNGINIEIATASYRSVRGATIVACLLDEVAFWRNQDTAANPDSEIIRALRPAMSTVPGSILIGASSPYGRRGVLWDQYERYHGKDGAPVLVIQAPTKTMNPRIPQSLIDRAVEEDPASSQAEYFASFRVDFEGFLDRDLVGAAVDKGVVVRAPESGVRYVAFCDPAGGTGKDSMTMAIAHLSKDKVILDLVYEKRPPFNTTAVVAEIAALLRQYRVHEVTGDHFAAGWPIDAFREQRIKYVQCDRNRSQVYMDALPLFTSGRVRLIENPRMIDQFIGLERKTGAGADKVDHKRNGSDDCCNSAAGALTMVKLTRQPMNISDEALRGIERPWPGTAGWHRQQSQRWYGGGY
jgi:hypothetical protein